MEGVVLNLEGMKEEFLSTRDDTCIESEEESGNCGYGTDKVDICFLNGRIFCFIHKCKNVGLYPYGYL